MCYFFYKTVIIGKFTEKVDIFSSDFKFSMAALNVEQNYKPTKYILCLPIFVRSKLIAFFVKNL